MKQQAALLQINRAARGVEGKNRVRPDARHGRVLRHQFGARRRAGAEDVGHGENVIHGGGFLRLAGGGNDLHVVHHLRYFGLLEGGGVAGGNGSKAEAQGKGGWYFHNGFAG